MLRFTACKYVTVFAICWHMNVFLGIYLFWYVFNVLMSVIIKFPYLQCSVWNHCLLLHNCYFSGLRLKSKIANITQWHVTPKQDGINVLSVQQSSLTEVQRAVRESTHWCFSLGPLMSCGSVYPPHRLCANIVLHHSLSPVHMGPPPPPTLKLRQVGENRSTRDHIAELQDVGETNFFVAFFCNKVDNVSPKLFIPGAFLINSRNNLKLCN